MAEGSVKSPGASGSSSRMDSIGLTPAPCSLMGCHHARRLCSRANAHIIGVLASHSTTAASIRFCSAISSRPGERLAVDSAISPGRAEARPAAARSKQAETINPSNPIAVACHSWHCQGRDCLPASERSSPDPLCTVLIHQGIPSTRRSRLAANKGMHS